MWIFRYLVAGFFVDLCRSTENQPAGPSGAVGGTQTTAPDLTPTEALARLGSKAALGFAFAFLKRAWRCGEDGDLCADLLRDALHALRVLPAGTLFRHDNSVWLEVIAMSHKFLRSVILE